MTRKQTFLLLDKSGSKTRVCSLPSHTKTPFPEETIRGRNLCCLSKQIKFQRCNKTEVCLKAIAEGTADTLPSGFLIKAATAIIIWQMVVGFHTIRVIMFPCSCTAVYRKSFHVIIFKCSFYVWGRWSKGWEQLKVKVSRRRLCLYGFYLPEKERLSSGPLSSNLLRQHINYTTRLGCHLLQTGHILIERCRYKKHLWFVSFLWTLSARKCHESLLTATVYSMQDSLCASSVTGLVIVHTQKSHTAQSRTATETYHLYLTKVVTYFNKDICHLI